jgi:predicted DNA-binding WGR domain protein
MRHFEFRDDKSSKFWNIELQGESFTAQFGNIGTDGQTQVKKFADVSKAKKEHDKLVAEKIKKGYVEVGGSADPVAPPAPASPVKAAKAPKDPLKLASRVLS